MMTDLNQKITKLEAKVEELQVIKDGNYDNPIIFSQTQITYNQIAPTINHCSINMDSKTFDCFKEFKSNFTYDEALNHCRQLGANLAEPRVKEQYDKMVASTSNSNYGYWIGVNDRRLERR